MGVGPCIELNTCWTWTLNPAVLPLEELLGFPQALAELNRIDVTAVGIPYDYQTRGVGRPSCKTPVILLFYGQLSLVL